MPDELKEYGRLSNAELEKLKKQHGKIFTLEVAFIENDEDVILVGYLKKPARYDIGMAMSVMETNPLKAKEIILTKSWICGDERIKTDDDAFLSASTVIDQLLTVRLAQLKKN